MAKISFLADEGCSFSGISGLIDSFNIANIIFSERAENTSETLFNTEIVSPKGLPFQVAGGYRVTPQACLSESLDNDIVIIPAFLPNAEMSRKTAGDIMDWICGQYERGAYVAALCTGAFVLAETGLLNGRTATTNWLFARKFRARYPNVHLKPDRVLTHDARLVCSGSFTAFYHIGLFFIEEFGSVEMASLCSKIFLVDANRTSQASYTVQNMFKNHGDDDVLKAQVWLEKNFSGNIRIDHLARQTGISPRHFIRRFKKATGESPLNYLQQIRIETAKNMLETRESNIDEITHAIGYENSCTFRKLFKECTGLSPREYRDKFSRKANAVKDGERTRVRDGGNSVKPMAGSFEDRTMAMAGKAGSP